jgi:nucleotide-binding universal stress UspA family protein
MIPQIKKILYATDLSRNSAYAFYYAVDLAQKKGATIVILNAIEPIPAYVKNYITDIEKRDLDNQKEIIDIIQKRLNNFCQKVDAHIGSPCVELVSKVIVRVGHPIEEILSVADEEGCDMIILGNHGKGFLKQTFLGSVSRGVLDRTRKPVFIIPLPPESEVIDWASM